MKKPRILFVCEKDFKTLKLAVQIALDKYGEHAGFEGCFTGEVSNKLSDKKLEDFNLKTPFAFNGKSFDIIISLCSTKSEKFRQFAGFPVIVDWSDKIESAVKEKALGPILEKELQCFFDSGYFSGIKNYKFNMDLIINSLGDAVIAHDLNRRIYYFNKTAEQITGYTQEEVLGNDCHDVFPSPICGKNCSFCVGLSPDQSFKSKSYKTTFHDKSGTRKELKVNIIPIRDSFNILRGVTASIKDLTELNLAKEQILKEQNFNGIIGKDPEMLKVFQQIKDLALYDTPAHIYGETGTGKELVARAIHNESIRSSLPFVPINCGALPEGLIESELFGHVKGAFSGAIRDKKGRFELADKGTIFLDEVGELPKNIQVKLLRVLQEGTFEKVGGESTIKVDVRVLSATNRNLKQAVQKGEFRDDLYYRLNVVPIYLVPLKKRKNDIPVLCAHFLKKIASRHKQEKLDISKRALSALMDYDWPGNVRELENIIEYSIIHSLGSVIDLESLPEEIQEVAKNRDKTLRTNKSRGKLNRAAVIYALEKTGGNKTKAAKILGVGRATLYRYLNNNSVDFEID
ncbi:MAG: sigma 54-interacting transcriptional regulator [Desulforegulaceae bacterium]|nr:sigma 54-interacting transcriptional regulator [Desulforegulaceae bacterium]